MRGKELFKPIWSVSEAHIKGAEGVWQNTLQELYDPLGHQLKEANST